MAGFWEGDGVLEYESVDGFAIRAHRAGNVVSVECEREGKRSSVTIEFSPDSVADRAAAIGKLEAFAISGWKAAANLRAIEQGLPRPFRDTDNEP